MDDLFFNGLEISEVIEGWLDFDFISSQLEPSKIKSINRLRKEVICNNTILNVCHLIEQLSASKDFRFNPWFDVRLFESLRPDVAKHAINTSLFFITELINSGLDSGYFQESSAKIRHAKLAFCDVNSLDTTKKYSESALIDCHVSSLSDIQDWFSSLANNLVLSFSHDNAYNINGGVQSIIRKETLLFTSSNYVYVHIFPKQARSAIADLEKNSQPMVIGLSINGIFKGYTLMKSFLLHAIRHFKDAHIIIHHLYGFNVEDLIFLLRSLPKSNDNARSLFWCHDHTILCSKYNLMFNNFKHCRAASLNSFMCKTCSEHDNRIQHLEYMQKLINVPSLYIIYPSKSTRDTCINANALLKAKTSDIIPHFKINNYTSSTKKINLDARKVRIAFLGHTVAHKGWNEFLELRANPRLAQNFEFHYFGTSIVDDVLKFTQVDQANTNCLGMTHHIKKNNIDIVFSWSLCPETFCLTAYEALAAGAHLITNYDSGNIATLPDNLCTKFINLDEFQDFLYAAIQVKILNLGYTKDLQLDESSYSLSLIAS